MSQHEDRAFPIGYAMIFPDSRLDAQTQHDVLEAFLEGGRRAADAHRRERGLRETHEAWIHLLPLRTSGERGAVITHLLNHYTVSVLLDAHTWLTIGEIRATLADMIGLHVSRSHLHATLMRLEEGRMIEVERGEGQEPNKYRANVVRVPPEGDGYGPATVEFASDHDGHAVQFPPSPGGFARVASYKIIAPDGAVLYEWDLRTSPEDDDG